MLDIACAGEFLEDVNDFSVNSSTLQSANWERQAHLFILLIYFVLNRINSLLINLNGLCQGLICLLWIQIVHPSELIIDYRVARVALNLEVRFDLEWRRFKDFIVPAVLWLNVILALSTFYLDQGCPRILYI